jgi:hypothetical protein
MPGRKKAIPRATPKENRMYEDVKESELHEGKSPEVAKRIGAATVNKLRRKRGETKKKRIH